MNIRRTLLMASAFLATLGAIALAQAPGINSPFNTTWSINLDSIKRTYGTAVTNLSPTQASVADIWQLCGSSTATIKLTALRVGARATAVQALDIFLTKRSTWDGSGTVSANDPFRGVSINGIALDSSDSASTALVIAWTASPTQLGTFVGNIASFQIYTGNLTTGLPGAQSEFLFGDRAAKAPTLRGQQQCLSVNVSQGGVGGNLYNISAEWTEE